MPLRQWQEVQEVPRSERLSAMAADGRAPDKTPKPRRQQATNNDAELARSFLIGCGVLFVVFLIGSGLIAWFWLR